MNDYYESLKPVNNEIVRRCDCRVPRDCPLNGNCLQSDVMYKAEPTRNYIGISVTTFKVRWRNHKTAFDNQYSLQSTTLSTYYWKLKLENKNPRVSFSIIKKVPSYTPEYGKCRLCTAEKLQILKWDPSKIINKRKELMSKCRHKAKFYLENYK